MTELEIELLAALKESVQRVSDLQITVDQEFRVSSDGPDLETEDYEARMAALIAKAEA